MGSHGNHGNGGQESHFSNLDGREGSLYSLTLNELQDQLGEPLHGMNLDDLLRNVLPSDEIQSLPVDLESTPSHNFTSGSCLDRQSSLFLARNLSNKTVDEVWKNIQQQQHQLKNRSVEDDDRRSSLTLGEMTLEDFLVKAGAVAEFGFGNMVVGNVSSINDPLGGIHSLQQYHRRRHQMPNSSFQQMQVLGIRGGALDAGIREIQNTTRLTSSPLMGPLSDTRATGRKRVPPGEMAEKTVERKQKRMIKNRESAARSRARKQAYTSELENMITRLEEENQRLKKQQELDEILHNAPLPEPKFRLRRTSSSPL